MEHLQVIRRVDTPTDWCAGMVIVAKPRVVSSTVEGEENETHKVRICVDLTKLNESFMREKHELPSVDQTLGRLAGAKVFTKLDAKSEFWQIPLAPNIPITYDLHNSLWQILLSTFAIWDNISPRTLPEEDSQGPGRSSRSAMHDG